MGDDITIGVTEIVNNIEVTAQPNDQIVDISVIDNADDVTLNITPTVIEINVNKGSSYAKWGTILGTLSDQTDLQDALDLKADLVDGKVPSYQLPSYVDDVIEVANYAALPVVGESGKIYVTIDNNHIFRWTGSTYVEITDNTAVWGAITGTLSSQTDLQDALNTKVPYTGATGNVNLGEYGLTSGYVRFDTTPTGTPSGIGTMYWDTANRTVSLIDGDGDTTLQIGQEERILVHNNTGSTLTDGQVVYVTGSTGELPSVSLANASNESTSAATIGVVTESIANGADGFITTSGLIHGLNTLAFTEGDLLWLGTTAGTYTNTKPTSPNHLVLIGYVIKRAGGNGSILVKIQNTQELEESSDVLFSGLATNQILAYESSPIPLWKNKTIPAVLGYTPADDSNVVHKLGSITESITGEKTFNSDLTINGITAGRGTGNVATNTAFGSGALGSNTSGVRNSGFGRGALYSNTTGSDTSAFGESAGQYTTDGVTFNSISTQSLFLGSGTKALGSNQTNQIVIGYNAVGNGSNTVTLGNTEIIKTILQGKVGIGTTSPVAKLDMTDVLRIQSSTFSAPASGIGLEFRSVSGVGSLLSYDRTNDLYKPLVFDAYDITIKNNGNNGIYLSSAGKVGIGTTGPSYTLHVNGSVAGTSAYNNLSDKRYKKDILPIENALGKILALNGVTFNWDKEATDKNLDDNNHIGLLAQDVEEIVPQAVTTGTDENETKSVAYTDLVPVLIEAIKELKAEIDLLKQK